MPIQTTTTEPFRRANAIAPVPGTGCALSDYIVAIANQPEPITPAAGLIEDLIRQRDTAEAALLKASDRIRQLTDLTNRLQMDNTHIGLKFLTLLAENLELRGSGSVKTTETAEEPPVFAAIGAHDRARAAASIKLGR